MTEVTARRRMQPLPHGGQDKMQETKSGTTGQVMTMPEINLFHTLFHFACIEDPIMQKQAFRANPLRPSFVVWQMKQKHSLMWSLGWAVTESIERVGNGDRSSRRKQRMI